MVDPVTSHRLMFRLIFVALAAFLLFAKLLPLFDPPGGLPRPDLLLCAALVWVQRRPDILTPLLLAFVLVLSDLLLGRPPGLWAALCLLGAEFLRSRHDGSGEVPFILELGFVAAVVFAAAIINWVVLAVFSVPHPRPTLVLIEVVFTLFCYPVVAGLSVLLFNLFPLDPAEADAKGAGR